LVTRPNDNAFGQYATAQQAGDNDSASQPCGTPHGTF
jgi:hypothetical protein